jgi:hypothetical protein
MKCIYLSGLACEDIRPLDQHDADKIPGLGVKDRLGCKSDFVTSDWTDGSEYVAFHRPCGEYRTICVFIGSATLAVKASDVHLIVEGRYPVWEVLVDGGELTVSRDVAGAEIAGSGVINVMVVNVKIDCVSVFSRIVVDRVNSRVA